MKVCYVGDSFPREAVRHGRMPNSIFLAGPTPRSSAAISWRIEALATLKEIGFDGHVFVPETASWGWLGDYSEQVEWEWMALGAAACVLFWIPRALPHMPAFTTNVEFGFMMAFDPRRCVVGSPPEAEKMRYLNYMADNIHNLHWSFSKVLPGNGPVAQATDLRACLTLAVEKARQT